MRIRTLPAILAAALTTAALAMAPAVTPEETTEVEPAVDAATEDLPEDEEPELYEACPNPNGHTVVRPGTPVELTPETPVGALNGGILIEVFAPVQVGTFMLDLEGFEVGTAGRFTMTLDWDTPGGLGDYDLVVDGTNDLSVDQPETHTKNTSHCGKVTLGIEVFTGTPLDTLSLKVSGTDR